MNAEPVIQRLRLFEGSIPYMYRCTGGEVTVGIGHAILTPGAALALQWEQLLSNDRPPDERIEADYWKVASAPKGQLAKAYEPLTTCRMSDSDIDTLADADIIVFSDQLDHHVEGWEQYPEPAQEALFDMAFNLGIGGLKKFPKMLNACSRGDWSAAAAESRRNGIPNTRNEAIRQLFLDARGALSQ